LVYVECRFRAKNAEIIAPRGIDDWKKMSASGFCH